MVVDSTENSDFWPKYYDLGFREELKLFDTLIDSNESNALRALNIFRSELKGYKRSADGEDGVGVKAFHFVKKDPSPPSEDDGPMLPTGRPVVSASSLMGKGIHLPAYFDPAAQISGFIVDYLRQHPDIEAVVELGSGTGGKLVEIFYGGCPRHIHLYAAEQSPNARAFNRRLVDMDTDLEIDIHEFDFRYPDLSFIKEKGKVLFFTSLSMMFVETVGREVFDRMVDTAGSVTGLHFEPIGFQIYTVDYTYSKFQEGEFKKAGWNSDLGSVLQELHNDGTIAMDYLGKDIMPESNIYHALTIVLWHKAVASNQAQD